MAVCKITITVSVIVALCSLTFVNSKDKMTSIKEVVVVGGGLAGMAAARRLSKEPNITVRVLEARKERYGGRIWTKRNVCKGIRGVDVELGAMLLNSLPEIDTKLVQLAEEFELSVSSVGTPELHFIGAEETKIYAGESAAKLYTEAFRVAMKALRAVQKEGIDRPIRDVYLDAVDEVYTTENDFTHEERASIARIIMSFPVTTFHNFSSLLYNIHNEFGWDRVIVDGVDTIIDRIVAGSGFELPIKIELNKAVRNIQVDNKRKKVLIRTTDGKQVVADNVVVALPLGVLQTKAMIIDPPPPAAWFKAVRSIGIGYSMKVVVGFDKAFWPRDVGTFSVFSELASDGFLQTWTNAYKFSGNPFLLGDIFGSEALVWETRPEPELQELVTLVLSDLFGADKVNTHNMTTFMLSKWSTDDFTLGSLSYPKVGNSASFWNTLQQPVCPYVYFAGAYIDAGSHFDSLHGAYNSGIRAAEQIITGVCKKVKPNKTKSSDKSGAKPSEKKQKKDEL